MQAKNIGSFKVNQCFPKKKHFNVTLSHQKIEITFNFIILLQAVDDFKARLKEHGDEMFDPERHAAMIKQLYYIEDNWTEIIQDIYLTPRMKEQQSCIWELLLSLIHI